MMQPVQILLYASHGKLKDVMNEREMRGGKERAKGRRHMAKGKKANMKGSLPIRLRKGRWEMMGCII